MDIVMIGHIMKEFIRFPGRKLGPVLGSPAAYTSVGASRLGAITGLVTVVGSDMPGELLDVIRDAKVNTDGVKVSGPRSRVAILTYDDEGRKKLDYPQAPRDIMASDIPKHYLKAKGFLVCPINGEVPAETVQFIVNHRRDKSVLMTDLGGYIGAATTPEQRYKYTKSLDDVGRLVGYFDVVKASVEDCGFLFANTCSHGNVVGQFLEWGAKICIITLGDRGSFVATGNDAFHVSAIPANTADSTGAGDEYSAAFLVEYTRTADAHRAALYASAASAIVVEATGGVQIARMPSHADVLTRLAKHRSQLLP